MVKWNDMGFYYFCTKIKLTKQQIGYEKDIEIVSNDVALLVPFHGVLLHN